MTGGSDSTAHRHPVAAPGPWRPCTFCLGEQELGISGHVVALVGGNQLAAMRLIRVLPIVKPIFQGLATVSPLLILCFLK